jgi:hypothetical protein
MACIQDDIDFDARSFLTETSGADALEVGSATPPSPSLSAALWADEQLLPWSPSAGEAAPPPHLAEHSACAATGDDGLQFHLHACVEADDWERVVELLEHGAAPTPPIVAAALRADSRDMVMLLMDAVADDAFTLSDPIFDELWMELAAQDRCNQLAWVQATFTVLLETRPEVVDAAEEAGGDTAAWLHKMKQLLLADMTSAMQIEEGYL